MAQPSRAQRLLRYLPFASSTTPLHALTYLLGISLFSISFLVFLNSSVNATFDEAIVTSWDTRAAEPDTRLVGAQA